MLRGLQLAAVCNESKGFLLRALSRIIIAERALNSAAIFITKLIFSRSLTFLLRSSRNFRLNAARFRI